MTFEPDLSVFYEGEFSEIVSIAGQDVSGIFEDPFASIDEFEGSRPTFKAATASLPSPIDDGTPFFRPKTGKDYKIISARPSGRGSSVLVLHEV